MNKAAGFLLLFVTLSTCLPVQAAVTVTEKTLQKGLFSPPKCDDKDECLCEADIEYPLVEGMKDAEKQASLNVAVKKTAEQLVCKGEAAKTASKGDNFSIRHKYEVTFQSPDILSLKFTDWAYEGGAHSNSAIEGMIIDLESGKTLTIDDIFGRKNIKEINQIIYDALAPKAEGIFRDEVESRKDSFIKDGKCQGCTLVMSKNGIIVIFQAYEVAPFADGNPEVLIPVKYISYKALIPEEAKQ